MKIILTGSSGLVGSRFVSLLSSKFDIIPFSSGEVKITDFNSVDSFFQENKADLVIHLAAKTDVDACEKDKEEDLAQIDKFVKNGTNIWDFDWNSVVLKNIASAFAVNTIGTQNIYKAAKKMGAKCIYISTDFVFPGIGEYKESSAPQPINWYGMTKYFGEKMINTDDNLIVRTSFPYGYPSPVKQDFVQKLISFIKEKGEVNLIDDQTITPTFIDDIVYGLDFLILKEQTGIYHVSGSSYVTPFEIGTLIGKVFGFSPVIHSIKREDFYKERAARPFKSIVKNDKLVQLGFKPIRFEEGLDLIKNT